MMHPILLNDAATDAGAEANVAALLFNNAATDVGITILVAPGVSWGTADMVNQKFVHQS